MRKTSQDGGDSTSITSGFENEVKRSSVGIIKTKRNSIKRKVQNFSHESDDTVIEPLLQIDKNETISRSAKYLLSKTKTESISQEEGDIYSENKMEKSTACKSIYNTGTTASSSNISKTLHNHMNANVFGVSDGIKDVSSIKCPLLVEINGCRPAIHSNQTSSIFTTAKINANSISKNMEPIQVTPVPILSTIEGSVVKKGISPDYAKEKNIISPTSDILKSSTKDQLSNKQQLIKSSESKPEESKSDLFKPSTTDSFNKISSAIDNRSLSTTKTASASAFNAISKFSDSKMVNAKVASVATTTESVKDNTIQPAILITTDKKLIQNQKQFDAQDVKNIQAQRKDLDARTSAESDTINISTLTSNTNTSRDINITKKESTSSTSNNKQLQRQKNTILEDPRDSEHSVQTKREESDKFSKAQTFSSVVSSSQPLNQPARKTGVMQESVLKPVVASTLPQPTSLLKKELSIEKSHTTSLSKIEKPNDGTLFHTTAKEVFTKPALNIQPTQPVVSRKADLDSGKKSPVDQINKPNIQQPPKSPTITKEEGKSVQLIQQVPATSVKSDPKKDNEKLVASFYQKIKPETENDKNNTAASTIGTETKTAIKSVTTVKSENLKETSLPKLTSTVSSTTKTDAKKTLPSEIPKPTTKQQIATTVVDKALTKDIGNSNTKMTTEPKLKSPTISKPTITAAKHESTTASTAISITGAKPYLSSSAKLSRTQDTPTSEKHKSIIPQPATSINVCSSISLPKNTITMAKTQPNKTSTTTTITSSMNKSSAAAPKTESISSSSSIAKPITTNSSTAESSSSKTQNVISKVSPLDKHGKI